MRLREKGEQVSSLAPVVESENGTDVVADADAGPVSVADAEPAEPEPAEEEES
jgi:hypothetical protein